MVSIPFFTLSKGTQRKKRMIGIRLKDELVYSKQQQHQHPLPEDCEKHGKLCRRFTYICILCNPEKPINLKMSWYSFILVVLFIRLFKTSLRVKNRECWYIQWLFRHKTLQKRALSKDGRWNLLVNLLMMSHSSFFTISMHGNTCFSSTERTISITSHYF